jgi:putative DNA primase/helicase
VGKPRSHWLYRCPGQRTRKPSRIPIELRSTGGQTVFPPSIHPSGETIAWSDGGALEPASLTSVELEQAFGRLAAATLIARAAPDLDGQMHDVVLALAGALWHEGWPLDDALALILPALEVHGGADPAHREQAIRDTWDENSGRNRYGWTRVAEILGEPDCKALQRAVELVPTKPRGVVGASGPLTDAGNAERFADDHGDDLRYCAGLGWLQWDGVRWAALHEEPYSLAIKSARKLQAGGEVKFGRASEDFKRLRATVSIARTLPSLRVELEDLDADPWLLNTPTGLVDLRTGELRAHDKLAMCTRLTGVPFDAAIATPRFDAFMLEVFANDSEVAEYVLRYLGQGLTGLPAERCMQVWHGTGSNGKSTLLDLLLDILGDYAKMLSIGLLLEQGRPRSSAAASPDLAALRGVRFAAGVETAEYQRWNESLVKQLTGKDKLTARHLHKEPITFAPSWTLALATNHRPIVRGVDPAIWDRIHLVPFEVRFTEEKRDRTLHETLRQEAPGVLAKLVTYCMQWRAKGFCPPASIADAVAEYQHDQDTIGEFLTDACSTGPGLSITKSALWAAYKQWAEDANEYCLGKKAFNQRMFGRFQDEGTGGRARWLGVSCGSSAAVVKQAIDKAKGV